MQTRFYDFGATVTNNTENLVTYATHPKGVYRGFDLGVDTDGFLTIGAGYGVLDDGIIWTEDETRTLAFYPPGIATDYTILAYHEDRDILGGTEVIYSIMAGYVSDSTMPGFVALGWIRYPGGGSLDPTHLIPAQKKLSDEFGTQVVETAPIELIPPITRSATSLAGPNITFTETAFDGAAYLVYQEVANDPAAVPPIQQLIQNIVVFYEILPVYQIEIYHKFANTPNTSLIVGVFDTSQAPVVPITGGTITGTGTWTNSIVQVNPYAGTFQAGKPYTIRLTHNVNLGENIQIGRVKISFWPYP